MTPRRLLQVGGIGTAVAAICCATPIVGIVLGALGVAEWAGKADYAVLPLMALSLALVVIGLFRRKSARMVGGSGCCPPPDGNDGAKP